MYVWGSGGIVLPFLTSALNIRERSVSLPDRFSSWESGPGSHSIGSWVGPRATL